MSTGYQVGEHYFLLRYLDDDCEIPVITTLVYLGTNLFPHETSSERWFFQDANSFVKGGPFKAGDKWRATDESNAAPDAQLWEFPEDQLCDIHTAEGLAKLLLP